MKCDTTALLRAQAANITDQDIDAIIQKGMRATDELNEKMKQYTENAMAFTLDGGFNAYDFKDDDDVPEDVPNLKQLAGNPSRPLLTVVPNEISSDASKMIPVFVHPTVVLHQSFSTRILV